MGSAGRSALKLKLTLSEDAVLHSKNTIETLFWISQNCTDTVKDAKCSECLIFLILCPSNKAIN